MSENNRVKKISLIVISIIIALALIVFAIFKFFPLRREFNKLVITTSESSSPLPVNNNSFANSKTAKIFNQNVYEVTYSFSDIESGEVEEIFFIKDGKNSFTRVVINQLAPMETIIIDNNSYYLDHNDKLIYHSQIESDQSFGLISEDYQESILNSSQETIEGLVYDTEEFGDGVKFYYLNDQLKMIKEEEATSFILIKSFSTNIDRSNFVLPSDYQIVEEGEENQEINFDENQLESDLNSPTND